MKKRMILMVLLFTLASALFAQGAKENAEFKIPSNELTVYCYDSFAGEWGPGPTLIPLFEQKTGIKVNLVSCGDAGEMIAKVVAEGDSCPADVILGVSDDQSHLILSKDVLMPYDSPVLEHVNKDLLFDKTKCLLPFDYGAFAFVYDSESSTPAPTSLADLLEPEYKNKFILIDPRTSSVGLGLLFWTIEIYGESYIEWWKAAKENALTIADGWSSAYGLFTEGEAPIVLSYTTSPVYHVLWEDTTRYQALVFDQGHYKTTEGVGILKTAENVENAKTFIDFILTDGQKDIAVANSMYPVNTETELPSAYEYAPVPATLYQLDKAYIAANIESILQRWTEELSK